MRPSDVLFAQQIEIVKRLHKEFSEISVLSIMNCPETSGLDDKIPMRSANWQASNHLIKNLFSFLSCFFVLLIKFRPTIVFCHMCEAQAALISIPCRIFRIPLFLWYAHISRPIPLVICEIFATRIFTSTKGSYPRLTSKVLPIGQSVDENFFLQRPKVSKLQKGLSVGRLDPSKRISHIISEIDNLRRTYGDISLDCFGAPSNVSNKKWWEDERKRIIEKYNWAKLSFKGTAHRRQLPQIYGSHDFFVHAFVGSLDKTLIEATLSGLPVFTDNDEYAEVFGYWNTSNTKTSIHQQFIYFLTLNSETRLKELERRQLICIENHSAKQWISKVTAELHKTVKVHEK
jgi:glycosyltransferase involved in cell wall biosynthesis